MKKLVFFISFFLLISLVTATSASAQTVVHVSMSNLTFVGASVCGGGSTACIETVNISFDWNATTNSIVSGSMPLPAVSGAIVGPYSFANDGPVLGGQGFLWTDMNGDSVSVNTCGSDCQKFPSVGAYNTIDITLLCGSAGDTCFTDGFQGVHPTNGTFTISSGIPVFSPPSEPSYNFTFTESGLAANTNWSVSFNGQQYTSSSSSITSSAPNGHYSYTVSPVGGNVGLPSSGTVTINGANVNQEIQFSTPTLTVFVPSSLPLSQFETQSGATTPGTITQQIYIWFSGTGTPTLSLTFQNCSFTAGFFAPPEACSFDWLTAGSQQTSLSSTEDYVKCGTYAGTCIPDSFSINANLVALGTYTFDIVARDTNGNTSLPASVTVNVDQLPSQTTIPNMDVQVELSQGAGGTYTLTAALAPQQGPLISASYVMLDEGQKETVVSNLVTALQKAGLSVPGSSGTNASIEVTPTNYVNSDNVELIADLPALGIQLVDGISYYDLGFFLGVELTATEAYEDDSLSPSLPTVVATVINGLATSLSQNEECLLIYKTFCGGQAVTVYLNDTQYIPRQIAGQGQKIAITITGLTLQQRATLPSALTLSGTFGWYAGQVINVAECGAGNGVCIEPGTFSVSVNLQQQCVISQLSFGCSADYVGSTPTQDPTSPFIVFSGQDLEFSQSIFDPAASTISTNVSIATGSGLSEWPLSVIIPTLYDQNRSSDFELDLNQAPIPFKVTPLGNGYQLRAVLHGGGALRLVTTQQPPQIAIGTSTGGPFVLGGGFTPNSSVSLEYFTDTSPLTSATLRSSSNGSFVYAVPPTAPAASSRLVVSAADAFGRSSSATERIPSVLSGNVCDGYYDGLFIGNISVFGGQNCVFMNGRIEGNIIVEGGSVSLTNTFVGGDVKVEGGRFFIDPGTKIQDNLLVQHSGAAGFPSQICGATVLGNLQFQDNTGSVSIGTASSACAGNMVGHNLLLTNNSASVDLFDNIIGGNVEVKDNSGLLQIVGNNIAGNLHCEDNSSIIGSDNTARKKQGQCSAFQVKPPRHAESERDEQDHQDREHSPDDN